MSKLKLSFISAIFFIFVITSQGAEIQFKDSDLKVEYSTITINGYASFWVQSSTNGIYELPVPISADNPISIDLKIYNTQGYVDVKTKEIEIDNLKAKIKFYAICPYNGKCPENAYFSAEVELSGLAQTFCGSYFNKSDFLPFPVFFCSGYYGDKRIGITLHREKFLMNNR